MAVALEKPRSRGAEAAVLTLSRGAGWKGKKTPRESVRFQKGQGRTGMVEDEMEADLRGMEESDFLLALSEELWADTGRQSRSCSSGPGMVAGTRRHSPPSGRPSRALVLFLALSNDPRSHCGHLSFLQQ